MPSLLSHSERKIGARRPRGPSLFPSAAPRHAPSTTPSTHTHSLSSTMPPILISGTLIDFPHDPPYGTQKVLMGKVVAAADRRAHALLEAPTGSGKTLALLCATLAWQERLRKEG
jgi:fanconi anemia group J protein